MLRTGISWDNLADAQFPTRGSRVDLHYALFRPVLGGEETGNVARLTADLMPDLGALMDRYHLPLGTRLTSATDNAKQRFAGLKTPLGPVFLGYGYAGGGHDAVYLTFGSLLRNEP